MTPQEFEKVLKEKANEVKAYGNSAFPAMVGNTALRFINGNFRAQGFQGASFKLWKKSKGTVLVKSGALRAATYYTTQPGQATIKNNMPYAKAHNEGFKGTVTIKAHDRHTHRGDTLKQSYTNKKGKSATRTIKLQVRERVKSHTRKMDIPKRQFMPTSSSDSPVLMKAIQRNVSRDLLQIFKR